VYDFNEISTSKLLGNNIKVTDKFCVLLVHSFHRKFTIKSFNDDFSFS
jgi:hypothetical protein